MLAALSFSSRSPRNSRSGIGVAGDTRALNRLARDLRRAAPEVYAETRGRIRAVAEVVADGGRSNAEAFSTRIPGTVRVVGAGLSVKVIAGGDAAPDAAPLENKGREGTFRHPVFGDRQKWVEQQARPFLAPALDERREMVEQEIEAAAVDAVRRVVG